MLAGIIFGELTLMGDDYTLIGKCPLKSREFRLGFAAWPRKQKIHYLRQNVEVRSGDTVIASTCDVIGGHRIQ